MASCHYRGETGVWAKLGFSVKTKGWGSLGELAFAAQ
jgi:hypothetical protein